MESTIHRSASDIQSLSDEELIAVVCNEDQELYRDVVKRYQEKLVRYATYLLNNEDEAYDVVQEAFIKAYINLRGFDTKKKFSSWIYRIVHNEAMNSLKKKKHVSIEANEWLQNIKDDDDTIEEQIEKAELTEAIKQCIGKLSDKYRNCLVLYFVEEKSYDEISDILQIPIGTVGTNINRGKKMMRELCAKENHNLLNI